MKAPWTVQHKWYGMIMVKCTHYWDNKEILSAGALCSMYLYLVVDLKV
jgi:hypothetical protein